MGHIRTLAAILVSMSAVACSPVRSTASPPITGTPTHQVSSPRPTVDPTDQPTVSEASVQPPSPDLVALAPRSMRAACKSIDLNDAEPEIVCELDGVELYLARWATKAELIDSVVSSLDASECERLDAARGSITVAGRRIGRGGGCVGESEFAFANEVDLIEGNVFVRDGELADAQAWFRDQRPTLPTKGKLTGAALEAPLGQLSVARLRDRAKRVGYRSLLRHADDYQETLLHYRGQVLQPLDDGALVLVTHRDGQWSDPVFVAWDGDDRLLEDDLVEFAGLGSGTYSYVTVLGDQREVPAIDAIDLVNHD